MGTLSIRATFKGKISLLSFFGAMIIVGLIFTSLSLANMGTSNRVGDDVMSMINVMIWTLLMSFFIGGTFIVSCSNAEYEIHKSGKYWARMTTTRLGPLGGQDVEELMFDRIVRVKLNQSFIDRYLGTGSLTVSVITHSKTGPVKSKFRMLHIENAERIKEQILLSMPPAEPAPVGLAVMPA